MSFLLEQHALAPVVRLLLGLKLIHLITRPDPVRRVLVTGQHTLHKGGPFVDTARTLIGDGPGTCAAADHRYQRPLMNQAFRQPRIVSYTGAMVGCVQEAVASWQPGRVIDVYQRISMYGERCADPPAVR
ncbi:hypothetical protein [Embleya sp. AB8]|uniref:hypothetical protein n=1 Tax=Embleya sp. AB8 TaxID=3156304 RepID=UPI003C72501D